MSSIFDVPAGLLFVLSLATANPSDVATAATGIAAPKASKTINLNKAPCRHSEQAWYAALKGGAGGVAFSSLSERIFQTTGGRYYVPVAKDRRQLLQLQRDNAVSCFIALSSAATNAARLKVHLGRDATLSDLYAAHVFGSDRAIRILKARDATPKKRMADVFPTLDAVVPGLYAGRRQRMTLDAFSNRLDRAIRAGVKTAHTVKKRSRRRARASAKRKQHTQRRLRALVHKAKVSARDIHRRGTRPDSSVAHSPHDVQRFELGAGLGDRKGENFATRDAKSRAY